VSEPNDMDRPVTKRELIEVLNEKLANYATKADLERALARYATKEDLKLSLEAWGAVLEDRIAKGLSLELKQHTKVILESLQGQVSASDDKYKDLPPRVKTLEAKVFAPKRRRSK
jgi:hypothetical protein